MTIETWDPSPSNTNKAYEIDTALLKKISVFMDSNDSEQVSNCLSADEIKSHKDLMQQTKENWFDASSQFSNEEIINLIKFFTLAEVQYSNWQAEEKSPVIGLAKALRQRGENLDKDFLKWIKSNNPNKFLPYGPLM